MVDKDNQDAHASAPADEPTSLLGFVASGAWKLATGAPRLAIDLAHHGLSEAERRALSTLRRRMDAVADGEAPPSEDLDMVSTPPPAPRRAAPASERPTAAGLLAQLLETSMEQTVDEARERLALRVVRQLVPDETRILAALADGHESALVHLGAGPLVGPATQRWLENLSPVGKEAGARLLDEVPRYLAHLRHLGLLEAGGEDKSLQLKYQLIEADTLVRQTCAQIEKNGLRPKFFRRTIRISQAGKAFWAACQPPDAPSWK